MMITVSEECVRAGRSLVSALGVSLLVLLFVGGSSAGVPAGTLSFLGCASAAARPIVGCSMANLSSPAALVVSPDGKDVYITASASDAIEVFGRASDGGITPHGCLGNPSDGPHNCNGAYGLKAGAMAISPDGRSIYVAGGGTLTILARDANGNIGAAGCIQDLASPGLNCGRAAALTGDDAVAVSPDGTTVYTGSAHSIDWFKRATDGSLTPVGCLYDSYPSPTGCYKAPAVVALKGTTSLAVSPDGKNVYAGGVAGLSVFDRASNGALYPDSCVSDKHTGTGACRTRANLELVESLAFSPDGTMLFAGSNALSAVEEFSRGADGAVTEVRCYGNDGLLLTAPGPANCTKEPGLVNPWDLAVAGTGNRATLYVDAVSIVQGFALGSGGLLTLVGCVAVRPGTQPPAPANCSPATGFIQPHHLAVAPGGGSLYVGSLGAGDASGGTVVAFRRAA